MENEKNVPIEEKDGKILDINDVESADNETADYLIPIEEVINMCASFMDGKTSLNDMQEYVKKIQVQAYKPIVEKTVIISNLLFEAEFSEGDDIEEDILNLELYKFWYILLSYTNIDINSDPEIRNVDNYDLLYSVLAGYILSYCYADYQQIIKMFENAINVYNIKKLMQSFGNFDEERIAKSNEEIKKELQFLEDHQQTLTNLTNIFSSTL